MWEIASVVWGQHQQFMLAGWGPFAVTRDEKMPCPKRISIWLRRLTQHPDDRERT